MGCEFILIVYAIFLITSLIGFLTGLVLDMDNLFIYVFLFCLLLGIVSYPLYFADLFDNCKKSTPISGQKCIY